MRVAGRGGAAADAGLRRRGDRSAVAADPAAFRGPGRAAGAHLRLFADTSAGRWLIDARPRGRIEPPDEVAFAATGEVGLVLGWGYLVVTGRMPHVADTVDQFSAQRRPLTDRLGIKESLLACLAERPELSGELTATTIAPPIARAGLPHLLWPREVGMNLASPLSDRTLIASARSTGRGETGAGSGAGRFRAPTGRPTTRRSVRSIRQSWCSREVRYCVGQCRPADTYCASSSPRHARRNHSPQVPSPRPSYGRSDLRNAERPPWGSASSDWAGRVPSMIFAGTKTSHSATSEGHPGRRCRLSGGQPP
ncbi:hypothetical protein A4R44_04453 [Amycolatopsis sp. M39]|nr:hypothetical protein A4R44_04453 [Amycolatopsis sp. M39]